MATKVDEIANSSVLPPYLELCFCTSRWHWAPLFDAFCIRRRSSNVLPTSRMKWSVSSSFVNGPQLQFQVHIKGSSLFCGNGWHKMRLLAASWLLSANSKLRTSLKDAQNIVPHDYFNSFHSSQNTEIKIICFFNSLTCEWFTVIQQGANEKLTKNSYGFERQIKRIFSKIFKDKFHTILCSKIPDLFLSCATTFQPITSFRRMEGNSIRYMQLIATNQKGLGKREGFPNNSK